MEPKRMVRMLVGLLATGAAATTVTLQNGLDGYKGFEDTYFYSTNGGFSTQLSATPWTDQSLYTAENG